LHARLRAAERIASAQRELVQIATTDSLTGLLNRHEFFERADAVCARATVGSAPSAIMLDIDNFKRVNDSHGHAVGDAVIRSVGAELARTREIVGRLGGEEFAILLEGRALPDALRLAERLRAAMAQIEIVATGGPVRFTCSFGADEWEFGDTIDDLLQRADMALYVAKANGRNRVVAYEPAMAGPGVGTGIVRVAGR
jgi:diguanylate cyclase (GGDEF)-like protein